MSLWSSVLTLNKHRGVANSQFEDEVKELMAILANLPGRSKRNTSSVMRRSAMTAVFSYSTSSWTCNTEVNLCRDMSTSDVW
uniref:Uncharacterized protein n=1 Tax=Oryza glumipatula TaxID=40148 RepID=A0A0E0ASP3_9ORYZ